MRLYCYILDHPRSLLIIQRQVYLIFVFKIILEKRIVLSPRLVPTGGEDRHKKTFKIIWGGQTLKLLYQNCPGKRKEQFQLTIHWRFLLILLQSFNEKWFKTCRGGSIFNQSLSLYIISVPRRVHNMVKTKQASLFTSSVDLQKYKNEDLDT